MENDVIAAPKAARRAGRGDRGGGAAQRLGIAMSETRADGHVALEAIYCLGLCAIGPNALVDGCPVARIDAAALESIAQEIAA